MGERGASPIAMLLIFTILIVAFLAGGYYVLSKTKYAASMAKLPVVGKYFQPVKNKKSNEEAKAAQYLAQEGRLKIQERELKKKAEALEEQKALLDEREMNVSQKEVQLASPNSQQGQQVANESPAANQFKRLAKIYAGMEAKKAAAIMKDLDDNSIIIILSQMKPDQAAEIISALDPQQAAKITKIMMQPVAE